MVAMPGRGIALLTGVLLIVGCDRQPAAAPAPSASPGLAVRSPVFAGGAPIPARFTCAGPGDRPAIAWSGATAAAWAIVVDDPDAPGGDFYHWVVVDLPGGTTGVAGAVPAGAHEIKNSGGRAAWTPPCPPSGTHHYRFTVYGLRAPTGLGAGSSLGDALATIQRGATVQGRLTGLVTHAG